MAEDNLVTEVSDAEASKKRELSKKITEQSYDIANEKGYKDIGSTKLDITKPNKNG